MTQLQIALVDDDALPAGVRRVMVERPGLPPLLIVAASMVPLIEWATTAGILPS